MTPILGTTCGLLLAALPHPAQALAGPADSAAAHPPSLARVTAVSAGTSGPVTSRLVAPVTNRLVAAGRGVDEEPGAAAGVAAGVAPGVVARMAADAAAGVPDAVKPAVQWPLAYLKSADVW